MNHGPYRGPVRMDAVVATLGASPDGLILTTESHVGAWWLCGCQLRGTGPFTVICGCDAHERLWSSWPEAPLLQGYAGGRYVFGTVYDDDANGERPQYDAGDVVRIADGPHGGRLGTVTEVRANPDVGPTYLVHFRDARENLRTLEFTPGSLRPNNGAS